MTFSELLERIDWNDLRKQKQTIVKLQSRSMSAEEWEALEGLLSFFDAFQDAAAESIGDDRVFPWMGADHG